MKERRPAMQAERRTDVLILTASTGGGHDSVASALQEAIHTLAPEIGVHVLDPFSGHPHIGPLSLGRWYDAMIAHVPWLWGLFYHATNNAWAVRLGTAASALLWGRRLRSILQVERPALVVAVHPLGTGLAAAVLRTLPAAPPLHCVVTDLVTIHRYWACTDVGTFYVATAEAGDALAIRDIPRQHIHLTGLPLRASFAPTPRAVSRQTPPQVLLLGGGYPSRQLEKIAYALVGSGCALRLVVVCGRNKRLRQRLARSIGTQATVLGWCDDVAALMQESSVVVTKGGPTTVAEALSQARPLLIYQVLPGQETGNLALVERSGAGRYIPDISTLVRAVVSHVQSEPVSNAMPGRWWGDAAQRVAMRLLAGRADAAPHCSAVLERSAIGDYP